MLGETGQHWGSCRVLHVWSQGGLQAQDKLRVPAEYMWKPTWRMASLSCWLPAARLPSAAAAYSVTSLSGPADQEVNGRPALLESGSPLHKPHGCTGCSAGQLDRAAGVHVTQEHADESGKAPIPSTGMGSATRVCSIAQSMHLLPQPHVGEAGPT